MKNEPTSKAVMRASLYGGLFMAALVVLAACGEGAKRTPDPEIEHCVRVLDKLTKDYEDVAVAKVRDWEVDKIRNVAVTFDYILPATTSAEEDEALRGLMVCRYEYSLTRRTNASREAKALSVRFGGRQLSDGELILLNTAIAGNRLRLKWPKD